MPEEFRRLFEGPDEIEQFPDPFGRVGEGATEIRDPTFDPMGQKLFQDFRDAWAEGRALPELFGTRDTLEIKAGIGEGRQNRRPDVAKVETLMDALGEHDASPTDGPTGFLNTRLEEDLQRFQARNGLTVDSIVDPGGETLREIQGELSRTLGLDALTPPSARPDPTGSQFDAAAEDPLAGIDLPEGPGKGANLIPTQASGGLPRGTPSSPPTHRQAERSSQKKLTEAITGLDALEAKYRAFLDRAKLANEGSRIARHVPHLEPFAIKIDKSIKAYERYLDGTGGVVNYDPKWLLRHNVIQNSEQVVHGHFREWLLGTRRSDERREPLHQTLLKLKQNESVKVHEPWQAFIRWRREHRFDDQRLIVGDSHVTGRGALKFTRKGNTIEVTGEVSHRIRDDFTFTPDRVNRFPFGEKLVHNDMLWLQANGRAKPFTTQSTWRRTVVARLRVGRDPNTGKTGIIGFVDEPRWSTLK